MKQDKKAQKTDKIAFPSKDLVVEEEFLPSTGTHVEDHMVKASVVGEVFIDKEHYKAKVIPFKKRSNIPAKYSFVIGMIEKVSKSSIRMNATYVNEIRVHPSFSAIMHISDSSRDYVKSLDDLYAAGDIIRAKIIDNKSFPVQLETKYSDTGVIFTLCEICGENVKKIKRNVLKCDDCGHVQNRNTAVNYGEVSVISNY